jgi:hypothetical protein
MILRRLLLALLITQTAAAFAQSRGDVRIYIPLIIADDPAHADYFRKNFAMEIAAAGYTVTESIQEADYTIRMSVRRNSEPVGPNERQYMLQITLMRNSDTAEIVSLSFGFNDLDEMYNHNLSLVYQILANVPLGGGGDNILVKYMVGKGGEMEGDSWRNKWLYVRLSIDYPINYYTIKSDGLYQDNYIFFNNAEGTQYSRISGQTVTMPGFTAGLEFQFLDWMSLEANFELRLWDTAGFAFIPGVGAQLKFPLKPSTFFMIEPYVTGVAAMNLAEHSVLFPRYSIGGGIQLGVKGGNAGVFFFDVNYIHSLDEVITLNPDNRFTKPETLHWNRFVIGMSVGFKAGFINRGVRREPPAWLLNN